MNRTSEGNRTKIILFFTFNVLTHWWLARLLIIDSSLKGWSFSRVPQKFWRRDSHFSFELNLSCSSSRKTKLSGPGSSLRKINSSTYIEYPVGNMKEHSISISPEDSKWWGISVLKQLTFFLWEWQIGSAMFMRQKPVILIKKLVKKRRFLFHFNQDSPFRLYGFWPKRTLPFINFLIPSF